MSRGGTDVRLVHGAYAAEVTTIGAGLRALTYDGRDLVRPYGSGSVRPKSSGALLVPWPNRVVDGTYDFRGTSYRLDLSEPARGHAIHGLVAWQRFEVVERDDSSVVLRHVVVPRTGYPFPLDVVACYTLGDDGLDVEVTSTNLGDAPLPYGVGSHPYLLGGDGRVDDWTVTLPADEVLEVTPDRLVPVRVRPVAELGLDFRAGRVVGDTFVDHAFTGLRPDGDGLVRATVTGTDGRGAQCVWDPTVLAWAQLHTADVKGSPELDRTGMAVEPMSCPPDAYNAGTNLVVLEPGAAHRAAWRIGAVTS